MGVALREQYATQEAHDTMTDRKRPNDFETVPTAPERANATVMEPKERTGG